MTLEEKLAILTDAAKYDASCASSGSNRKGSKTGSTSTSGICHSWSSDGRCVSLLKILLSNVCLYDCAYCINRRGNDRPRATFSVAEVVTLTMDFYRRNYIEGLFLSSAVFGAPDRVMELMVAIARRLRQEEGFGGYIHLKAIPGTSLELMRQAGLFADRVSVNIELPSEASLKQLAPEKTKADIITPMAFHFRRRLASQHWIILDCRRQQAATWNGERLNAEHPNGDLLAGELLECCLADDEPSAAEARSQTLWKTFHRTVAIENRTSPTLQRQFMPARYWKHLTEMQG